MSNVFVSIFSVQVCFFFTHSQIKYRRTVVENLTENRNDCLNVRNQCSVTFKYEISREVHVYFAQYI